MRRSDPTTAPPHFRFLPIGLGYPAASAEAMEELQTHALVASLSAIPSVSWLYLVRLAPAYLRMVLLLLGFAEDLLLLLLSLCSTAFVSVRLPTRVKRGQR